MGRSAKQLKSMAKKSKGGDNYFRQPPPPRQHAQSSSASKHVESAKALDLSARLVIENAERLSRSARSLLDASKREVRASENYLKKARVQGDCNVPSTCADVQLLNSVKVQRKRHKNGKMMEGRRRRL